VDRVILCASIAEPEDDVPQGRLYVRMLNDHGQSMGTRDCVTLGRVDEHPQDYPGCVRRRDIVSLDVHPAPGVTCMAFGYEGAPEREEFICVEPHEMDGRRADGLREHTPAWLDEGYDGWMRSHAANSIELESQREIVAQDMADKSMPRFCLVMPVDATRVHAAAATIASLEEQTYDTVELIIAPVGTVNQRVLEMSDLATVLHEAGASEGEAVASAVARCRGTHVGVVEPGDTLEPDALFAYARAFAAGADAAYCDEDVEDHGHLHAPRLKPCWSPVAQMCGSYLGSSLMVAADIAREALRHATSVEQARMALALTLMERDADVRHLGRVLYHAAPSASHALGADDGIACELVSTSLASRNLPVACEPLAAGGRSLALAQDVTPSAAVIVLGDANDVRVAEPGLPCEERVALEQPEGLARVVNRLACDVVALVAPDAHVTHEGWLAALAPYALLPHVALAGALQLWPDGSVAAAGRMVTPNRIRPLGVLDPVGLAYARELRVAHETSVVASGVCAVRREVLVRLLEQGPDGLGADPWAELSLRALVAGYANALVPQVHVYQPMSEDVILGHSGSDALCALGSLMHRMPEPFAENDGYVNSAFSSDGQWHLATDRREPML
jgi:hypothetical protein